MNFSRQFENERPRAIDKERVSLHATARSEIVIQGSLNCRAGRATANHYDAFVKLLHVTV